MYEILKKKTKSTEFYKTDAACLHVCRVMSKDLKRQTQNSESRTWGEGGANGTLSRRYVVSALQAKKCT